jgi:hypothetical protein
MALRPRRVDAQLDAYVSGSGEWATGGDGDGDYEDACVAETWRDGGTLSEANARGRWHVSLAALFASSAPCIRVVSVFFQ